MGNKDFSPLLEDSESRNGFLEISEGLVKTYDPKGEGYPAKISPDHLSEIKINAEIINRSREVKSSDTIEITPFEEKIPGTIEVEITDSGLQSQVKVTPQITVNRKLKDMPPSQELILDYEEERMESKTITVESVEMALKEKNVIFGLDRATIKKAVQEADGKWHAAAHGKKVQEGQAGYVELLFEPSIKTLSYDLSDLSKVDYKERVVIPSVEEGDKMAVIHPAVPGEPGHLVTGKVIDPAPVQEIEVKCKQGCKLNEKGDTVFATISGRPIVEGKYNNKFSVLQVFTHNGDVDVKSGNVRFLGDLKVTGNIHEGMTVESQGNLEVKGSTAGAKIITGGSAYFLNNLINSNVTTGALKGFYNTMLPYLEEIEEIFLTIIKGAEQLRSTLLNKGEKIETKDMGRLAKLIVDKKFENAHQLAVAMLKLLQEANFLPPSDVEKLIKQTGKLFLDDLLVNQSEEQLKRAAEDIGSARLYVQQAQDVQVDLVTKYIQNCQLYSSGDILVKGTGSYNSMFNADGDINIEGVFRGGEITARGDLFIGEAGSPGLQLKQGEIHLSTDSVATFNTIYENMQVFFDKRVYKFSETRGKTKVYYAAEKDIIKVIDL